MLDKNTWLEACACAFGAVHRTLRSMSTTKGGRPSPGSYFPRLSIGHQFALAAGFLLSVFVAGTVGYMVIEGWNLSDSLYMTVIALTTTGFAEVRPLSGAGRLLTIGIIVGGISSIAYLGGRTVQVLVESYLLRRRRMDKKIAQLNKHTIVCGFGRMGRHLCRELSDEQASFVVIDNNPEMTEQLEGSGYLYLIGDASSDEVLQHARIETASSLIAVVSSDAENVFTTLTARSLNKELFIVTRAISEESTAKLRTAGADRVIKPYELVGHRLAQLVLRPGIVEYMETVARIGGREITIEEIHIAEDSPLAGQTLLESPLRRELNIIVVAIYKHEGELVYNPASSMKIEAGDRLMAIGEQSGLEQLTVLCAGSQKR